MAQSPLGFSIILFLRVLPKNLMSRIAGVIAAIRWPQPLMKLNVWMFGKIFGVNFAEVKAPLSTFGNIQEFFVRELVDGARPVDPAPDAFVSPCDGAWGSCGAVDDDVAIQVKGIPYSVQKLLDDPAGDRGRYHGGTFATLYLSPKDYHRFHVPCDLVIERTRYIPGALWPVNQAGVHGVKGLFALNERIVAIGRVGDGDTAKRIAMVAVGATMVGKVLTTYDDLTTNEGQRAPVEHVHTPPVPFDKGAEWGRFMFGSTLVLVAEPGLVELDIKPAGTPLRLGTRIGTTPAAQ